MRDHPELDAAFDAERFRANGHAVIDLLADYLATASARALPVLPFREPAELTRSLASAFTTPNGAPIATTLNAHLASAIHLHHPRYVGHQVTSPLPEAALLELVAALTNNGAAVYEMGPVEVGMERALIQAMSGWLGFPGTADGVFTSGGSAGNLTALLAARQARAGFDVWTRGLAGQQPLAVLASEQAHYSVARSLQIAGLGAESVEPVPVDAAFRLRPECLEAAFERARARGRHVIAIAASAGSTATGAFDPLADIADFAERRALWLHVDGAHGASAAVSSRLRPLLAGIERADSVVWDAHKMLLMPALVTAVLFRDGNHSYEAFAQQASYLFEGDDPRKEPFNLASRTLECTKRWMVLPLYEALTRHGVDFFARYVEARVAQAARFADALTASADFELAVRPESNIVCFRYLGRPARAPHELDALQLGLRREIVRSGAFYLVQTRLPKGVFLRTTLINPATTDHDLEALLETIRDTATKLPH
jgi:L-2,4-diaminobutyrate decarboxylase